MYEQIERITSLLRASVRRDSLVSGLQPVQVEALHYLGRCNRYSNTPMAVTEFLGLTKGTVSQTLAVLEQAGYLRKDSDPRDGRVVHLSLTEQGQSVLDSLIPPRVLNEALIGMTEPDQAAIRQAFTSLLTAVQQANGLKSFGLCASCRHHGLEADGQRRCGLTGEPLSDPDSRQICREHVFPRQKAS